MGKKNMAKSDEQYLVKESRNRPGPRNDLESQVNPRRWTQQENQSYAAYLRDHEESFSGKITRKEAKVYTKMARNLGIGKSNVQCRSHHQKMLIKHKNIQAIISNLLSGSSETASPTLSGSQRPAEPQERDYQSLEDLSVCNSQKIEEELQEIQIPALIQYNSFQQGEGDSFFNFEKTQKDPFI